MWLDLPIAIDLFAGAGGLTQGLKDAGFFVAAAVERDRRAARTHTLNHPEVAMWNADIRDIDPSEIVSQLRLPRVDLVAGCPPCQGFSRVRTKNGAIVADVRNDLIDDYVRFVEALQPRSIMLENVPGLLAHPRWSAAAQRLEELGYPATQGTSCLNAADYGVPQRRRRLVMLAVQGAAVPPPGKGSTRMTVRQAIGALAPAGKSGDALHDVEERRTEAVQELIAAVPPDGGSRSDLPDSMVLACHVRCDGFKDVYGRMRWNDVAPTITGGCQSPSKGRFLHPEENRAITLREAALLQGFPPTYHFDLSGGKMAAAAMIGNALPPPFIRGHAAALKKALDDEPVSRTPVVGV